MKIIFMGSAAFAVPSLDAVLQSGHEVALVVTQPDKPAGRGLLVHSCPVALFAKAKNLPLFQPTKLKNVPLTLPSPAGGEGEREKPDLIVVVAYGKLIPKDILNLPPLGCINLHASLLPKYRGAAPINWAIANGETKTGVTTMVINEKMDAGDILLQEEIEIGPTETAIELHKRLAIIGANLLIETLGKLGEIKPRPQNESEISCAPLLKKEDGLIDWKKPAKNIFDLIRGMQPWPIAYTYIEGKVLRIFKATPHPLPHPPPSRGRERQTIPSPLVACPEHGRRGEGQGEGEKTPGTIVIAGKNLAVATGQGTLYLDDVQLEGKKRLTVDAFLRGHPISAGTKFTSPL